MFDIKVPPAMSWLDIILGNKIELIATTSKILLNRCVGFLKI